MSKWLTILKVLGPAIIATTVPGGALIAPLIVTAIAEAEKIRGASGPEKKAAVIELVKVGVAGVNAASKGKVTIDPVAAAKTASAAIDTTIGVINLIRDASPGTRLAVTSRA